MRKYKNKTNPFAKSISRDCIIIIVMRNRMNSTNKQKMLHVSVISDFAKNEFRV